MSFSIIITLIVVIIFCLIFKPIVHNENFDENFAENEQDNLANYDISLIYLYNNNPTSTRNIINPRVWSINEPLIRTELNKVYNRPIKVFHYNLQSQLNFIVNREHPALWSLISPDCLPSSSETNVVPTLQYDPNGVLMTSTKYLNGEIQSKLLLCMIPLNNNCTYTKLPVKWNIPLNAITTNKNKTVTAANIVSLLTKAVSNRIPTVLPPNTNLLDVQSTNRNNELVVYNNNSYFDRAIRRGIDFWTKNYTDCPPQTVCPPPIACPRPNDNIENYEIHLNYIYNSNPSNSFSFYSSIWLPRKTELITRLKNIYPNIIINDYRLVVDTRALAANDLLWTVTNMYARQGPASRVLRQGVTAGNGFEFDQNGNFVQSSYTQTAMNPQIVLCLLPRNSNCVFTKVPVKWHIPDGVWVKGSTTSPVLNATNIVSELEKAVADRLPVSTLHRNQPLQSYQNIVSDPNIWVFNPSSYTDPVVEKAVARLNTFK